MILVRFILIRLILVRSKHLTVWDLKEKIVSIVYLVYYTLVENHLYKHLWPRRCRRYEIRRTITTSAFGRTWHSRFVYTWTTGYVRETVGRRLWSSGWYIRTSGMKWEVSRTVFRSWMLPLMGVEISLIDRAYPLFTYPNFSLIRTNI